MVSTTIQRNSYFDSVTLMRITSEILKISGIAQASVCMGTALNKELLVDSGLASPETEAASPNDLIIAFTGDDPALEEVVAQKVAEMLSQKTAPQTAAQARAKTIRQAVSTQPESNLAVISVPGKYAYLEAKEALMAGLNVMMFSDNLSLAEEKDLKQYASQKGLLMMGPDCGSAIINHTGIGFANQVASGPIGLIAASGTGLQEITVLIDRFGSGISQAIGVGGRDLSQEIGGIMMLDSLAALANDPASQVLVLLSKKPAHEVAQKIIQAAGETNKPCVICFLGEAPEGDYPANVHFSSTLEDAALKALELAGVSAAIPDDDFDRLAALAEAMPEERKYVRAVYSGGTLCSEAFQIFRSYLPDQPVFSNTSKEAAHQLVHPNTSQAHSFVDLGDDIFTNGKAHPMIDPSLRNARIVQEALDRQTAVIVLDYVIGYGAGADPVGDSLKYLLEAKQQAPELAIIAYVCGTDKDIQDLARQQARLADIGVILARSNAQAARMAGELVRRMNP